MKESIRQYAIILTNLYAFAAFTVINPFYPAVAERSGIHPSLIGPIISLFPISSITISLLLPKFMFKFGRFSILIIGLMLIGCGNISVSIIEHHSSATAIILSILSRMLAGTGSGCIIVASNSILSSDYPEKFQSLAALTEFFIGLGIIIGPLVGSILFSIGGFFLSCFSIGVFVLSYIPVIWYLMGRSREYVIEEKVRISIWAMGKKSKVTLNAFMGFCVMFAVGITMPTIEPHILSYGIEEKYAGYWYLIYTGGYCISAFIMVFFNNIPKQAIMLLGLTLLVCSMFLLGPCPFLFDRNVILAAIGHHLMGWGISLISIPLVPYIIELSHKEYNMPNDDRLNDSISSIVNIVCCLGQTLGPLFGSLLPELFGNENKYRLTFLTAASFFVGFEVFYMAYYLIFNRKKVNETEIHLAELQLINS